MRFDPALTEATFMRRYKRFFMDARLADGSIVTAHCPNTGRLQNCLQEGAPVLLEPAANPKRKLRWTWKMIRIGRSWVGVDTSIANALVAEAIERGRIPQLLGYERLIGEVKYGVEGRSRIDILLSRGGEPEGKAKPGRAMHRDDERVYVEVKNTTLSLPRAGGAPAGAFPDAVTERGRKHLQELMGVVDQGHRAAMVFSVQRSDCRSFVPADEIDPVYGKTLRKAVAHGVEAYALGAHIGPTRVTLERPLPIEL